jgi:CheY-specific phosphatase CheX
MVLINAETLSTLRRSVGFTFEGMLFMELDENAAELCADSDIVWTALEVKSPVEGKICIAFEKSLAIKIAESLFVLSGEELGDDVVFDAVAELVNIISGHFMKEVLPGDKVFELSIPETGEGCPPEMEEPTHEENFSVADRPFSLFISGAQLM